MRMGSDAVPWSLTSCIMSAQQIRYCLAVITVLFLTTLIISYVAVNKPTYRTQPCTCYQYNGKTSHHSNSVLKTKLIKLAKQIRKAKQHARGTKTSDALLGAQGTLRDVLKSLNIDFEAVTKRPIYRSTNVCSEVYKGTLFGYHLYNTGFVAQNCSYQRPISALITVVLLYNKQQTFDIKALLNSVHFHTIPTVLGHMTLDKLNNVERRELNNIKIIDFTGETSEGKAWNRMIAGVTTPYTLVARDVTWFNHDARLERLIRQIERLNVSSAGGTYRDISGHWANGCQQRAFRNYTLVYKAGYDESIEECMFCDHIDGPFVSKTKLLKQIKFGEKIKSQGLFEDFFLRFSKTEHVVCPDSMFYTNRTDRSFDQNDWKSFQKVWNVYKIKFSEREIIMHKPNFFPCNDGKGTSLTPWCQQENADLLRDVMEVCESVGLICELFSGSLLGTVKFHSILPWEVDADMFFVNNNSLKLKNAVNQWKQMGFKVRFGKDVVIVLSEHWRLEIFHQKKLSSQPEMMFNQTPTLCALDGHWLRVPRNPGLVARSRYGREIYRHAEHWRETGLKNSWKNYKTNHFRRCWNPGKQNCLDRYNADGNLQWGDPSP